MKSYMRVVFFIMCMHLKNCNTQVSPSPDCEVWHFHEHGGDCSAGNSDESKYSFRRNGTISDGSGPYGNSWNCWYWWEGTIQATIQFTFFDTQQTNDVVIIRKCNVMNSQNPSHSITLLEASGSTSLSNTYSSDKEYTYLTLHFKSDASVTKQGFVANW